MIRRAKARFFRWLRPICFVHTGDISGVVGREYGLIFQERRIVRMSFTGDDAVSLQMAGVLARAT